MKGGLRYAVKTFAASPEIAKLLEPFPEAQAGLFVDGVPTRFISGRYVADDKLRTIHVEGCDPLVRFASTGLTGAIAVSSDSGAVVEKIAEHLPRLLFVNSSLPQFTRTVEMILGRFPYYDRDTPEEQFKKVAFELLEIVRNIDPEAAVPDRYWSTFADDVAIGDFSTELIEAVTSPPGT
jgi:hypothetical protein